MTDAPAGPPSYYPVSLDLSNRPCLVVGAGPVAARKVRGLLACGARVSVIAPDVGEEMRALATSLADARGPGLPGRRRRRLPARHHGDGRPGGRRCGGGRGRRRRGVGEQCRRPGTLLVHPAGGPPRRGGHHRGVDGGLSPALASWLQEPARRVVRERARRAGPPALRGETAAARRGKVQRKRRLGRAARRRPACPRARRRRRQRQSNSAPRHLRLGAR